MSLENKQVEPVELAQMSIYQSNTCRKDLNWLRFDNEPSVQDRQQEKDEKSCISVFCNIYKSTIWPSMEYYCHFWTCTPATWNC